MQEEEIIKFLMGYVCKLEKIGNVCKLCLMLMHVFGRNSVEWRSMTMGILAYRAVWHRTGFETVSLVLVKIEIMCGIILI